MIPNAWNNFENTAPNNLGRPRVYVCKQLMKASEMLNDFYWSQTEDHPSTAHHASCQGSQAFPESKVRSQDKNKLILMIEEISLWNSLDISFRFHSGDIMYWISEALDIWLKLAHVICKNCSNPCIVPSKCDCLDSGLSKWFLRYKKQARHWKHGIHQQPP